MGVPMQPRFPKELHRNRAEDYSLTAGNLQASNVIRLEIKRVKGGERARALAATSSRAADQLRRVSCIPDLARCEDACKQGVQMRAIKV